MNSYRAVLRFGCLTLVAALTGIAACGGGGGEGSSPTAPPPVPSGCLQRAQFGDPANSSYVLPYSVGESYEVITGYCDIFTFPDHLGWDFDLPQGTSVVATRRGTVLEVGCFKGTEASDSARSVEQRTLNSD